MDRIVARSLYPLPVIWLLYMKSRPRLCSHGRKAAMRKCFLAVHANPALVLYSILVRFPSQRIPKVLLWMTIWISLHIFLLCLGWPHRYLKLDSTYFGLFSLSKLLLQEILTLTDQRSSETGPPRPKTDNLADFTCWSGVL